MDEATVVANLLAGIEVPAVGLVLRGTWDDPTPVLTDDTLRLLIQRAVESTREPVCGSTDDEDHWADVIPIGDTHWVARHVDDTGDEYRLFVSRDDAVAHYVEVVQGQADATAGRAWEYTDVPGVLVGDHLRLSERIDLAYVTAAAQYAIDPASAVAAWELVDVLA